MSSSTSPRSTLTRTTAIVAAALVAASGLLFPAAAQAKTTSVGGDYAVTVNGTTYNPAPGKDAKLKDVAVSGRITVSGTNNRFTIDPATLGVYDYTLTGAPDTQRMVTSPTVVFASKVPTLTAAQRSGARLSSLEVRDDSLVAIFTTAGGKLKIQAKDGAQGGIFQMEPEFAAPVELVHTLGPGLFYFVNQYTGKINFGNGVDAVTSGPARTRCCWARTARRSPRRPTRMRPSRSGPSPRVVAWAACWARTRSSSPRVRPTAPASARRRTASTGRSPSPRPDEPHPHRGLIPDANAPGRKVGGVRACPPGAAERSGAFARARRALG